MHNNSQKAAVAGRAAGSGSRCSGAAAAARPRQRGGGGGRRRRQLRSGGRQNGWGWSQRQHEEGRSSGGDWAAESGGRGAGAAPPRPAAGGGDSTAESGGRGAGAAPPPLVAGGGDSALDWTIFLSDVAEEVMLIHRRKSFRGALDSVEKVHDLAEAGKIRLLTDAQAVGLNGNGVLTEVLIKSKAAGEFAQHTDHFIPLFGLSPKLGPLANWGLNINKNAIEVDTADYATNVPGVFAIGDINTYPGKLKLILCGFHEATLAVQSAFKIIHPEQKLSFKYTTVNGVEAF